MFGNDRLQICLLTHDQDAVDTLDLSRVERGSGERSEEKALPFARLNLQPSVEFADSRKSRFTNRELSQMKREKSQNP